MKSECILSAGIDIGTTTTHLILSRIGISVTGGFGTVPAAQITSKEIVYKSPVYLHRCFQTAKSTALPWRRSLNGNIKPPAFARRI